MFEGELVGDDGRSKFDVGELFGEDGWSDFDDDECVRIEVVKGDPLS